jgi:hypothetical protein
MTEILKKKAKVANGWKKPENYHVTCLSIQRDEEVMESDIYRDFEENEEFDVKIEALLIVPGKIIVGICFPAFEIANKCAHVTLMINEWAAKESNYVLENMCLKNKQGFVQGYSDLKSVGRTRPEDEIKMGQYKQTKDAVPIACYFVKLATP